MQLRRCRHSTPVVCLILLGLALVYFCMYPRLWRSETADDWSRELNDRPKTPDTHSRHELVWSKERELSEAGGSTADLHAQISWDQLGVMAARDASHGWKALECNTNRTMRPVTLSTEIGNFTVYVRGSASDDASITKLALEGRDFFEKREITHFLQLSSGLPLIDVGANVGLVSLQAAVQKRQVVAVEPIFDNAVRVCRAALDFGHGDLVHVIQNAVSSEEGAVTLAMDEPTSFTHFTLGKEGKFQPTNSYAIFLDRLVEVVTFKEAALKIDVEGYEGHVLSAAGQLFKRVNIPLVWLEWVHLKKMGYYGGEFVIDFMRRRKMVAHDLMSGKRLEENNWKDWPFTVLWKKEGSKY